MIEFSNDDAGYLEWIAANPNGFVLNVRKKRDPHTSFFTMPAAPLSPIVGGLQARTPNEDIGRFARSVGEHIATTLLDLIVLSLRPDTRRRNSHACAACFSERVLELRLQKACSLLASPRGVGARVSQIAYACGFSDISYFNRAFRRRFGTAPTTMHGLRSDRS